MGKQSRRKNKRRGGGGGGGGGKHHRPTGLAPDDDHAPAAAPGGGGAVANIVKKIRHGDPRVRHAALVALSSTLFDSQSLSNAAGKNSEGKRSAAARTATNASDLVLLRTLAERVLDPDAPCAAAAAGCLSNYVSFYCGGGEGGTEEINGNDLEVASDVMVPILLRRMQMSLGTIRTMGQQITSDCSWAGSGCKKKSVKKGGGKKGKSANVNLKPDEASAVDKRWLSLEEQWSLLSLSLLALAGLVENCPQAAARSGAGAFSQLLEVLPLADDSLQLLSTTAIGGNTGNNSISSSILQEKGGGTISDAAANASRALHSLLDDNASVINFILVGTAAASFENSTAAATPSVSFAVTLLTNAIINKQFSDVTRLHAAGSVLSLWRALVLERELPEHVTTGEEQLVLALQLCTIDVVVPLLGSIFDFDDNDDASSSKRILSQMIALSRKLSAIKQDERMESQIEKEVNARKEPARQIARRQKKMKEEKKKQEKETVPKKEDDGMDIEVMEEVQYAKTYKEIEGDKEGGSVAMVVEEGDEEGSNTRNKAEEGDLKQELDSVVRAWGDLVGSHKLALELVANLCSSAHEEEGDDVNSRVIYKEDDDEQMWDSDDEAKLVAAASTSSRGEEMTASPHERAVYGSMASNRLPEKILTFFRRWMEFLPAASADRGEDSAAPTLVRDDIEEVLSTCALCLGNIAAARDLPTWGALGSAADAEAAGEDVLSTFWREAAAMLDCPAGEAKSHHVTSVMLSALRSRHKGARTLLAGTTLNHLLSLLQQKPKPQSENNEKFYEALLQTHCQVISMLGVLCQQPMSHPSDTATDAMTCRALLERLQSASEENEDQPDMMRRSVAVVQEILNVLMDVYGDDDKGKEEIFVKEDVLGHFQRCLPGFRRRVRKLSGGRVGISREETEVWGETALNASRFIKYKVGG
eukprot:CAMPEP_0172533846 /NCGR_PEP_ID=MMETSP1067-20121228/6409_1 /TAXON_ID=265564 ORGANISM="Thalassiosira punctigera, Strain Tpunct2005C2" /NCGR_SAMPLE_ID=MMETSP1067 /ASSEMBLY_ACC=CAM_ASM_000444 /LENGTH=928 /DNA_ID=CAMNT_0013318551 /DNA_START=185 /DNA_END=2971 /DNA_ORIENTATION=+